MTITNRCACMVDSCWRKGICDFCINNHGGVRDTVSCALSPEAYAARKLHWEQNHDEPVFPANTALGILSKTAMETCKTAILSLRDTQLLSSGCTADLWKLKKGAEEAPLDVEEAQKLAARLERLSSDLDLVLEQAEAAVWAGAAVSSAAKKYG